MGTDQEVKTPKTREGLKEEIKNLSHEIADLVGILASKDREIEELKSYNLTKDNEKLTANVEELNLQIESKNVSIESYIDTNVELRKEITLLKANEINFKSRIAYLEEEQKELEQVKDALKALEALING